MSGPVLRPCHADTRHTARFLIIWLFLLPLALWEKMHWGVVPATVMVRGGAWWR